MPPARWILFSLLFAVLGSTTVAALAQDGADGRAPAARPGAQADRGQPGAPAPKPIEINDLLKLWERQSSKLKTLDVWLYRIDKTPEWNDEVHYEGRAVFKSPQLAYLDFKKIKTTRNAQGKLIPVADPKDPKKRFTTPQETIICGADEVWQYVYPVKQIYVFPLAKEQRQRALDEGPLPFLFNMKAEEAKARYNMKIMNQNEKYYSILVEPKLKEDREAFKMAQIVLDTEYLLPARIALISPDNKSSKDFRIEHIYPNSAVKDSWFQGRPLKDWKLMRDANGPGQARGNIGAVGGQPAGQVAPGLSPRR